MAQKNNDTVNTTHDETNVSTNDLNNILNTNHSEILHDTHKKKNCNDSSCNTLNASNRYVFIVPSTYIIMYILSLTFFALVFQQQILQKPINIQTQMIAVSI